MTVHTRIAEITDSIARRSRDKRSRYLDRIGAAADTAKLPRKRLGCANQAHSFAGCGAADKAALRSGRGAERRYCHLLQRHAVGASALRTLPGADQGGGARGRRHCPGRGRRAGHVRRRHAGRGRDGAVAVLARRHRAWRRRSRCRTTCSMLLFISASATRSCPAS